MSRVYEQTRQMIRVTCRCKRLRGGKHIVNGHFWTIIRVGSLVTVSRHTAWAKSRGEHAGGPLTRESVCRRGGGWSSVLRTLLGAANVQTSKRPNANVQAPAKTSAAYFVADTLALPWAHNRCTPASVASSIAQLGSLLFARMRQRSHPQPIYIAWWRSPIV